MLYDDVNRPPLQSMPDIDSHSPNSKQIKTNRLCNGFGGVINMTNTVIGGGISIIACPYGIRYLGPLGFIICEIILGFLTFASCCLMVEISRYAHTGNLNHLIQPLNIGCLTISIYWLNKAMDAIITFNCICVVIVFLDTMLTVIINVMNTKSGFSFWCIVSLSLIFTYCLCLLPNTKSIRPASSIAVLFWISFLFFIYYNVLFMEARPHSHKHESNVFIGITAINLSWTCQFKALPVYENLDTLSDARRVFFVMFIVALCIYLSLGFAAYHSFHSISDSLIDNLQRDPTALSNTMCEIAQACLGLSILFSNPIFFVEAREHLLLLINYESWKCGIFAANKQQETIHKTLKHPLTEHMETKVDGSESANNCVPENHSLNRDINNICNVSDDKHRDLPMKERYIPTFCIVVICASVVALANTVFEGQFNLVGELINFIGGIAANILAWLMPLVLYLGNRKKYYSSRMANILSCILLLTFCTVFCSWILSFDSNI